MIELKEQALLELLTSQNCVWFVGSKVSERAPSCLPDAAKLKKLAMESLCGDDDYLENLLQKCFPADAWDEKADKLAKSMRELMPEVIFQAAQDVIGYDARKALRFFDLAKYNVNHECLAQLMKRNRKLHGKTIAMTTNFDHLLEEAMKAIGLVEGQDFLVHSLTDEFFVSDEKIIDIFKLHGSVQNDESLGMTLRDVGLRLPDKKAHVLRFVLENFAVLFAGYSGRDLDIYPVIDGSSCKEICWLMRPNPRPKLQADSLLQKFNGKIYKADLDEMFAGLNNTLGFAILERDARFDDGFVRDSLSSWGKKIEVNDRIHILANVMRHIGELKTSVDLLERAKESANIKHIKHLNRIRLLNDLGAAYTDINEWKKAEEAYKESFNLAQDEAYKVGMGVSKSGLAYCFYKQDIWNKAIMLYNESLSLLENYKEAERDVLGAKIGLGLTYFKQKLADKAIECLEPTLELVQSTGDVQTVIQARRILGLAYYQRDKGDDLGKALTQQNEALKLSQKIEDYWGVTQAFNNIAIIYRKQKKLDESIETHRKNMPNRERLGDMRGMGQTYYNLGGLYTDKAVGSYQNSIEYYERVKGPSIQDIVAARERLGKLHLLLNDFEKAILCFETNQETRIKLLESAEKDMHGYANAVGELGRAYFLNGEAIKALAQYDKVLEIYQHMDQVDMGKFKGSPSERYDNAMRHLKTGLGLSILKGVDKKISAFSDMIKRITAIR